MTSLTEMNLSTVITFSLACSQMNERNGGINNVAQTCSVNKVFLKISQNSQENT